MQSLLKHILAVVITALWLPIYSHANVGQVPMAPLLTEVAEKYLTEKQGLSLDAFTVLPISQSLMVTQCDEDIRVEPRGGRLETLTMTCTKPIYWKRHIKIQLGKVQGTTPLAQNTVKPLPTLPSNRSNTTVQQEQQRVQQQQQLKPISQPVTEWDVVILKTPLKKGHILQSEDVEIDTVDRNPGGNVYSDISQVLGLELKFALQFKHVLRYSDLQKQAMVRKGDNVVLISRGKGFTISMDGIAQNDASVGGRIKATNVSSGKDVFGILQKDKTVLVKEFK